jgi:hypothetical protein
LNLILSLDYELFFGARHGTPQRCLIEPCQALLKITERVGAKLAFFVDAGYLCKLAEHAPRDAAARREFDAVRRHLASLARSGHEIQLHIHPHWEDTRRTAEGWHFDLRRYALHSFRAQDILDIVTRYTRALSEFGTPVAYRAGGWVIQPFAPLAPALRANGIRIDSTVFPGGHTEDSIQALDFRGSPDKDYWRFDTDPLAPASRGYFTEVPIASIRVSPIAYWTLAARKLTGGARHRPWGNGGAIANGKRDLGRKLFARTTSTVSIDGPKARWLERAYREHKVRGRDCMVVMGHPKALTPYSLERLDRFLKRHPEITPTGYARYANLA